MKTADLSPLPLTELWWKGIILSLSGAVTIIAIWCLTHGITILFMDLYYFPIVLLVYRYRWKGCGLATLLAFSCLTLVLVFSGDPAAVFVGAFYRFLVFAGVAVVITYLSERQTIAKNSKQQFAEIRDRYLSLAPAIILILDRNGVITFLNQKGGNILESLPDEVVGLSWVDQFLPEKARDRAKQAFSQMIDGKVEQNRILEIPVLTSAGVEKIIRWYTSVLHDENGKITGTLGFGEDITAEKWAQDSLWKMQQFQESVIANANVWITVLEPDGTLLVWNDAAESISGYKKTGILGKKTIWKMLYPENEYRKEVSGEIRQIIGRDTFLENFETEIRCLDGTKKTIVWNTRGLRDDVGTITSYITIGRDITEQKSAESRASESLRFLATMINTLPIPVFYKDVEGRYLGCNPPFEEYLGIALEDLKGKTAYDISPKDLADKYTTADQQVLANPVPQRYETQVQYADGSRHDVIFYKASFLNTDGSVGGLIGTFLDITERKRMEEALLESESFNRGLVENLPEYIAVYGIDGKLLYVNPASAKGLGYDADELVGTHVLTYIAEKYHDIVKAKMAARRGPGDTSPYEIDMVTKDGLVRTVIVKATPIQYRNNPAILLLLIDITDRKKADEEIRKGSEEWQTTFDAITDVVFLLDDMGHIVRHNKAFETFTGKSATEIDGRPCYELLHGSVYPIAGCPNVKAQVSRQRESLELPIRDRWFIATVDPIFAKNGSVRGAVHLIVDITERKETEDKLRASEEKFRDIFNNVNDAVEIHAMDERGLPGRFIDVNDVACRMLQYSREELLTRSPIDFATDYHNRSIDVIGEELRIRGYSTFETGHRRRDGTIIPVEINAHVSTLLGQVVVVAVVRDITERKRVEESLRESRHLFADIISFLPDPTFVIDNDGKVLAWNKAIEQLSGVPARDIIGKGDYEYSLWQYGKRRPVLIDLVLHPDQDAARMDYANIQLSGQTITAQIEIPQYNSKRRIPLSLVASPLMDAQGRITGAIESLRDISGLKEAEAELDRMNRNLEKIVRDRTRLLEEEIIQRKRAENDVQAALDYTRSVIEANPDLIVVLDDKGTILDLNASGELLTGISKDRLIGTPYFGYLVDDGKLMDSFLALLKEGRLEDFVQIRNTDNHVTPLSVHATVIRGSEGIRDRIIVSAHDITRQKEDEKAIRASLDEKVLLLREVHHRVKNNLQIIISLVNLQMRQTEDPLVKQIMSETQNRVRAMSLVHEKLYRSESLSRIDFADYSRFLATQLFSYYGMDSQRVHLDFTMGEIMVDINTAVPLGLLMNELISNSLKHAFPHDREGVISISGGDEGGLMTLIVRDNGIGIPAEFDWKNTTSLGMRLVTSLIDQVDGTVTLDRKGGTTFTITLRRKPASGVA